MRRSVAFLFGIVLLSCKGDPSGPPPVATVELTVPAASMMEGATQQLATVLKDASGSTLTDRAVTYSSTNNAVATVGQTGVVTAVAAGSTNLIATSEQVSDTVPLNVTPVPVASVSVSGASAFVAGGQEQLTAIVRGANGASLNGRTVAWSSSATGVATVTSGGLLTAIGPGTATIAATAEGISGTLAVSVAPCGVASTSPSPIVPGSNATVFGVCFGLGAAHTVTIRGVVAPVLSATSGQIVVSVPCVASGNASVVVTTAGVASPAHSASLLAPQLTLGPGQSVVRTTSASSVCNEIPATTPAGRYLVAVYSTATSASTLAGFELSGNPPAAGSAITRIAAAAAPAIAIGGQPLEEDRRDAVHWAHLERERTEYSRAISKARLRAPAITASDGPPVGTERDLFLTFGGGCNDVTRPMHVKAVYSGTRAVIWEDTENTLQTAANATYAGYMQRLGQIFDQDQYDVVRNNFGDPLIRDALTDNDARVHMVYTQKLNPTSAAAYVTSCDMFPRTQNLGSNFGEFFYGEVPTNSFLNVNSTNSPDGWFYFMARTVVHEVKHIASLAARIANSAPTFESSWLEEGTARHAEEMWVRDYLHRVPWKANTGFGTAQTSGIYCDFHPTDATCNAADPLRRPSYGMRRHFNEIRPKLLAPWDYSPFGDGTGQSGSTFYQTSWSLVRYAIDRYATSEPQFFRALVNATTSGVTNLTTVAGVSLDQLLGGWSLALFADDYPGIAAPNPDVQFATWNLRNIYAGLNASPSWVGSFPTAFPLSPTSLTPGSFTTNGPSVRGGAAAYYEIVGVNAPQILNLRGATGGVLSTNIRIAVTRLQ